MQIVTIGLPPGVQPHQALSCGQNNLLGRGALVAVPDDTGQADYTAVAHHPNIATARVATARLQRHGQPARIARFAAQVFCDTALLAEDHEDGSDLEIVEACDAYRARQLAMELACTHCSGYTLTATTYDSDCARCASPWAPLPTAR